MPPSATIVTEGLDVEPSLRPLVQPLSAAEKEELRQQELLRLEAKRERALPTSAMRAYSNTPRRWAPAMVALLAIVVGGGLGLVALRVLSPATGNDGDPTDSQAALSALPAGLPPPSTSLRPAPEEGISIPLSAPASVPSSAPARLALSVTTDPPGAAVWLGKERLGETPLQTELDATDHEVTLTIKKPGFAPLTHTFSEQGQYSADLTLAALPKALPKKTAPKAEPKTAAKAGTKPTPSPITKAPEPKTSTPVKPPPLKTVSKPPAKDATAPNPFKKK